MKNFTLDEFKCSCCGKAEMNQAFLDRLDAARTIAGIPFVISSGYRCPSHNEAIGSNANNHPLGLAADIRCTDGLTRFRIIKSLLAVGFTRVGVAKTFIHCDTNNLPSSIWFY